jgi:hypothetical protein
MNEGKSVLKITQILNAISQSWGAKIIDVQTNGAFHEGVFKMQKCEKGEKIFPWEIFP